MKSHRLLKQVKLGFPSIKRTIGLTPSLRIALLTPLILIAGNCDRASAQIIPDESLGEETSRVTPNVEIKGSPAELINGGALREINLFHSFEQFNVDNGQRVYFANPTGVENIFSRVTGSNLSEIMGTLGVNGNADLFLINPNGIVFGENASLDVNGSFVGSTADAIQFGDRGFFSATEPETPPLLTIKPSAFFFNQINPGRIENRSTAPTGIEQLGTSLSGLRVPDGKSLLLLGGDIIIDGGGLNALDGRIGLFGVAGSGTAELNFDDDNLSISIPETIAQADISLFNEAVVNTSGENGGSMQVESRNVTLRDKSFIVANTLGNQEGNGISIKVDRLRLEDGSLIAVDVNGSGKGGNLTVEASESVQIIGESETSDSALASATFGEGNAGELTITTKQLVVEDGGLIDVNTFSTGNAGNLTIEVEQLSIRDSQVSASSSGEGNAGDLNVRATNFIDISGKKVLNDIENPAGLFAQANRDSTGDAGNLTINTRQLLVRDGAQVAATTSGNGDGGTLSVNATESIQMIGGDLFAQANRDSTGDAGNLTINTRQLLVQDGAQVAASTFGKGNGGSLSVNATESVQVIGSSADGRFPSGLLNRADRDSTGGAGDLTINTRQLLVQDGARVSVSTFGEGDGGSLSVNATESVQVIGSNADGQPSGLNAQATSDSTGNGGDLSIETGQMIVRDGAEISVSSLGSGVAGDLKIQARSFSLDNQGTITATTSSGDGGNITLKGQDLLLMRRGSQISTTAGTAESGGDGGDINIAADLIATIPQENSDITANAFTGTGGNINIDTQNIFGFRANPSLSNITASSQFGLDGTININTSGIEPGQESIELPLDIVDVSKLINRNLCLADGEGEFIITGQGGLSPSPQDTLNTDAGWEDWRMVENGEFNQQQSSPRRNTNIRKDLSLIEIQDRDSHKIVEAQSWFVAPNGNIVLSAQPVKSVSRSSSFRPFSCQSLDQLQP